MPRERDRTTGVGAYVGTAEGVPCPVETNCMYIHLLMYRLHALYGVIAWKRFETVTVFHYPANVFCHNANQRACHVEGACEGRHYMTTGQQWEGVNDLVSTYRELVS